MPSEADANYVRAWRLYYFAQWPVPSSDGKKRAYANAIEAYLLHARELDPPFEVVRIPFEGAEIVGYLRLPNYTGNLRRLGYTDADIDDGGSDRLMSDVVPHGPEAVLARIGAHLDAGADHVLVQLIGEDGRFAAGDLTALAELTAGLR